MLEEGILIKDAAYWGIASFAIAFSGCFIPYLIVLVTDDAEKVFKSRSWLALNALIVGIILDVCGTRLFKISFKSEWADAIRNTLWVLGTFGTLTLMEGLAQYLLKAYAHHGLHVHHHHVEIRSLEESANLRRSMSDVQKANEDCDRSTACAIINIALHTCADTNTTNNDPRDAYIAQRSGSGSCVLQTERCHPHTYEVDSRALCQSANAIFLTRPLCNSIGDNDADENKPTLFDQPVKQEPMLTRLPSLQDHDHSDKLHTYMDYLSATVFYLAFSVHSVIEGCGLATSLASSSADGGGMQAAKALGIGIVAHKGLAAIAVGGSILKLKAKTFGSMLLMITFSCATPAGIVVGIFHDRDAYFTLVMNQITTGSVLFVLIHELIPQLVSGIESKKDKNRQIPYSITALVSIFVVIGGVAMFCAAH